MPRGSEPQRRRRVETITPRASVRSRPTEALARPLDGRPSEVPAPSLSAESAVLQEAIVTEPPSPFGHLPVEKQAEPFGMAERADGRSVPE